MSRPSERVILFFSTDGRLPNKENISPHCFSASGLLTLGSIENGFDLSAEGTSTSISVSSRVPSSIICLKTLWTVCCLPTCVHDTCNYSQTSLHYQHDKMLNIQNKLLRKNLNLLWFFRHLFSEKLIGFQKRPAMLVYQMREHIPGYTTYTTRRAGVLVYLVVYYHLCANTLLYCIQRT